MKPRFLRLSYFAWLVVPLTLYGSVLAWGLPHGCWSYSWIDRGQGSNPFAHRYYTRCRYVGPYGAFDFHPSDGKCPWFRFYHAPKGR